MVRGYQKRIIYLKNTKSRYFDEAYFVVKEDNITQGAPHSELVEEANRIIDENYSDGTVIIGSVGFWRRSLAFIKSFSYVMLVSALPFTLGALLTFFVLI